MLKIKEQSNYLAKVVRLKNLRKHTNADRLQCVAIDGNNVITGMTMKDGDIAVYFPLESQINFEFLSHTNSFEDKELNTDKTIKGYFASTSRVRATKLRGEKSEGYIVPVSSVEEWLATKGIVVSLGKYVDEEFDTVGDINICKKYKIQYAKQAGDPNSVKTGKKGKKKNQSRMVEGQYSLSVDTSPLKKNIHTITPDTMITVSYKLHGCNFSMGKVQVKKKLKWYEKLLIKFGVNVQDKEYDTIYASRSVVKNNLFDRHAEYTDDVWGAIAQRYSESLEEGISINGEIVGYTNQGKAIQKGYDYGQAVGTCELYVYRVYYTSPKGKVYEFNTTQMTKYCDKYGIRVVPIHYNGLAKNYFPNLAVDENWNKNFLDALSKEHLEKDCYICKNKVPAEGVVVIQNDYNEFKPLKLKSFAFNERETKELDQGVVSIEDEG